MASVAYQSDQHNSASTASVAVNKPASLAVGELMTALIAGLTSDASANTISAPAGWSVTQRTSGVLTGAICTKVADANDVAASTFTFTASSPNASYMYGYVSRWNATDPTPTDQINSAAGTDTAASTSGITPTKALGEMVIAVASFDGSDSSNSVSGYAIATDNAPSWTEAFDASVSPGASQALGLALAHGSRTKLTATGNASATILHSATYVIFVFNIAPLQISTLSMASAVLTPTQRNLITSPLSLASDILDPTLTIEEPLWVADARSDASWAADTRP